MNQDMTLTELKRQFLEYTEIEKGRALKTIENYDRYLSTFLDFLQKNPDNDGQGGKSGTKKTEDPASITADVLREYRLWLNRKLASEHNMGSNSPTIKKRTQN